MRYLPVFFIVVIIGMTLFTAGCTSLPSAQEKNVTTSVHTDGRSEANTSLKNISKELPDSDQYYYNIKIISPASLKAMEKEIGAGEYLIHNDKGDLIGVVSPKFLYIRGDLVQLQKNSEAGTGSEFDKTDIAEHLVDIAFGFDNAKLVLFKSDKDYKFWFDGYYSTSDLDTVRSFAKSFNSLSDSTQFEDEEVALGFLMSNYADIPYNFYNIRIVPENMLDDYKDDRSDTDHLIKKADGTLIGIVAYDHLYLLDSLTDDERSYYIKKGLLYSMGLHGTSFNDRESFFYREDGLNRNLSDLDTEAVRLLYGGRLKSGMDLEETRKTLGIST